MPRTYGLEEMLLLYADVFPLAGYEHLVGRKIEEIAKGTSLEKEMSKTGAVDEVKVETIVLRSLANIAGSILRIAKRSHDTIMMGAKAAKSDPYSLENLPYEVLRRTNLPFLLVKRTSSL